MRTWRFDFEPGTTIEVRFEDPAPIGYLTLVSQLVSAQIIDPGRQPDPSVFGRVYSYQNVLTDEAHHFEGPQVKTGFDTKLVSGGFYRDLETDFNYFIRAISGDLATIELVESFQ